MPNSVNIYGNPNGDKRSYPISAFNVGGIITSSRWNELLSNVNLERSRRGYGGIYVGFSNPIARWQFMELIAGLDSAGYPNVISGVTPGSIVYASHLNSLIQKIQGAGSVCFCDCNYCTCNCNYCTCDCNYSCTCNCNYSDFRLKKNIKFLYKQHGLNIYSWSYKWDDKVYEGVIAQELLKTKFSKAVLKNNNGYYMVNYNLLPIKLKEINE